MFNKINIKSGDTLWSIARDYSGKGSKYWVLKIINGIGKDEEKKLPIGRVIYIPKQWKQQKRIETKRIKTKKLKFYFRIEGRWFTLIEIKSNALVDGIEYGKLHEEVRKLVSNQTNLPLELIEKITEREYIENN